MKRIFASTLTLCSLLLPCARASAFTSDGFLARYLPSGALDTSFSGDGILTTGHPGLDRIDGAHVLSDGKVLVGVNVVSVDQQQETFVIARYNANGTSDTTFGYGGITTYTTSPSSAIMEVATDSSGRIVATLYDPSTGKLRLVRFNATGVLDSSWTIQVIQFPTLPALHALSTYVNPSGGATVGVRFGNDFKVIRYQSNGQLDFGFGIFGIQTLAGSGELNAIMVDGAGKTFIAGNTLPNTRSDFTLRALNSNGTVDNTFSFMTPFVFLTNGFSYLMSAARDGNGSFLLAGAALNTDGPVSFVLTRNLSNGSVDSGFNGGLGFTTTSFAGSIRSHALSVAPILSGGQSGKTVVVGIAYDNPEDVTVGGPSGRLAMARYTSAGALDTSFDGDGKVVTNFGTGRVWRSAARIADSTGKVLAYGSLAWEE